MKIVVNGQLINYTDEGSGRIIIMFHGWGTNLNNFDNLAAALAKQYRVIRLDFPGFGASPAPPAAWSVGDYVQSVQHFLSKYGVSNLYAVIAHSFGGRVALKMIGSYHLSVDKLVLIGSGGVRRPPSHRQQLYKGVAKIGGVVAKLPILNKAERVMRQKLYESAGSTDYLDSGDLRETFLKVINEDLQTCATNITTDTLLLWGENDDQTPVSDAKLLNDKIKKSRLVVYPNASHFTHLDEPQAVLSEIGKFLS